MRARKATYSRFQHTQITPGLPTTMSVRLTRLLSVALIGACFITAPAFAKTHPRTHAKSTPAKGPTLIWRGDVATATGVVDEVALAWQKSGKGTLELQPFNTASGIDAVSTGAADLAGSLRASSINDKRGLGRFDLDVVDLGSRAFTISRFQFHMRRDPDGKDLDLMVKLDDLQLGKGPLHLKTSGLSFYATLTQAQAWNAWARYENRRRDWSADRRAAAEAEGAAAWAHDRLI